MRRPLARCRISVVYGQRIRGVDDGGRSRRLSMAGFGSMTMCECECQWALMPLSGTRPLQQVNAECALAMRASASIASFARAQTTRDATTRKADQADRHSNTSTSQHHQNKTSTPPKKKIPSQLLSTETQPYVTINTTANPESHPANRHRQTSPCDAVHGLELRQPWRVDLPSVPHLQSPMRQRAPHTAAHPRRPNAP